MLLTLWQLRDKQRVKLNFYEWWTDYRSYQVKSSQLWREMKESWNMTLAVVHRHYCSNKFRNSFSCSDINWQILQLEKLLLGTFMFMCSLPENGSFLIRINHSVLLDGGNEAVLNQLHFNRELLISTHSGLFQNVNAGQPTLNPNSSGDRTISRGTLKSPP